MSLIDVKTAIEHEYSVLYLPPKLYTPKNKFLVMPLVLSDMSVNVCLCTRAA